jgi:hypothetical protein
MNIAGRLKQPELATRTVDGGFSLLRRCVDGRLLVGCGALQSAYPETSIKSNVNGRNRLGMHLLVSGEVRQQRAIGRVSLPAALGRIADTVPSVMRSLDVDIVGLQTVRDFRNDQGPYYLEACFSEDSRRALEEESSAVTQVLESLAPASDAPFSWSELPETMGLASLPANSSPGKLQEIEQAAKIILQIPLRIGLTDVQCTIPGFRNT